MNNKDSILTSGNNVNASRRKLLAGLAAAAPVAASLSALSVSPAYAAEGKGGLKNSRRDFAMETTYINGAYTHPVSRGAAKAVQHYLSGRVMDANKEAVSFSGDRTKAMNLFAELFNAHEDELAWIPSTMHGENHVVAGLGLHQGGRVVTDVYHFTGSLFMYNEMAKKGLDLHIVEARDNKIQLDDLEKAITPGTKLVALTLVSNIGGFQHDLKAVCDIAHAKGAMVYADIIQCAGATPVDLHSSGVDFAACSTYKWLMGDFGIGIMYARRESQQRLQRSQFGYRQEGKVVTHFLPGDPAGDQIIETEPRSGLAGLVEIGTMGSAGVASLAYSLEYLKNLGIQEIENWRQPFLQTLHQEIPKLGYKTMTPKDSRSPIITFECVDKGKMVYEKLQKAGVEVTVYKNRFRISPSFYNTMNDVETLIRALS
ncbi:aminotransferase class V-fold PLP-dependent enzyme [Alteromonas sp. 1_MG-2023]|uniref:aminotransferase class V-fold PLP-dependent enzyme n=1 Tax=Alteromonas sp. 1_MG-2023 TaxID=3062669 RepID=UPI0026E12F88|nr:aminotransferase class V-fold PLP-dependent enzyme [Alteromonas sp. 1_MG-2023]MDO6474106.1 aminotransferase class V-fold PLP-dependent enzyme [Alteromonas sp. 1_MG-2023]